MLTPPKWHSVLLKSQCSSKNITKKTMFFKGADNLFEELRKCCNSPSKDLALEALSCWRIWIENQQEEAWKENEICYAAVKPLLTKKFHPLHRDVEVSEAKLSLMWLALHKTQYLMHLEGPQHILEVFIQSCLSWLSCADDVGSNMENLILKLLRSLFSNNVEINQKNKNFPPLNNDIWKTNKLFCRLVTLLLEIFQNWTKIKEKTDLLHIWKYFLGYCELSFKLIPVAVWHKIFKLVDSICSDQKELMINKMSLLHKSATLLKSVLSNSKFIDCSQVLTTPAEALLKTVIELSLNNKDDVIPFDIFQYCSEICQVLSNYIIHTFGYEFCIHMLYKIEDIDSKPLLWGLWCGLVSCFRQQASCVDSENYSKMELKLYRKLRSVAVNFDLDRMMLEEKSVFLIHDQLNFLRVPVTCKNCSERREIIAEDTITMKFVTLNSENLLSTKQLQDEFSGGFGFDIKATNSKCRVCLSKTIDKVMDIEVSRSITSKTENPKNICVKCRVERNKSLWNTNKRWIAHRCGLNYLQLCIIWLRCDNIQKERLMTLERGSRGRLLFVPMCLTVLLEELCDLARKGGDQSAENFIEKVKKVQSKVKEGEIATPIKLFLSFKGSKGVEFYLNAVRFYYDLDEIINDLDLLKNLNFLKTKNDKSVVRLSMFFFLVNFAKNLFFEDRERKFDELRKLDDNVEEVLVSRLVNFMRKVSHYKTRLTNFAFLDGMNRVLPTKSDNPLIVWTNFVAARHSKVAESENSGLGDTSSAESSSKTTNDNLVNIFKCFDEFESKLSKEDEFSVVKSVNKVGRKFRREKGAGRCSMILHNHAVMMAVTKEVKIMENKSVAVVTAPPDIFRTVSFSEWRVETGMGEREYFSKENARKRRRNSKIVNTPSEIPRKKPRQSSENKTASPDVAGEVVQNENVNIETKKSDAATPSPIACRKKRIMNVPLMPKCMYSLRKRPLQRPSKFNDMKCLLGDDFTKGKSLNKTDEADNAECCTVSAYDCFTREDSGRELSPESLGVEVFKSSESVKTPVSTHLMLNTDKSISENSVSTIEEDTEDRVDIKVEVKDEMKPVETDLDSKNCVAEISELTNSMIDEADYAEELKMKHANLEAESTEKVQNCIASICEPFPVNAKDNRRVKRHWKSNEDSLGGKKIKAEPDGKISDTETEQEEPVTVPPKASHRPEMPVIQNRGSRMLSLIPESPKLNGFHDLSLFRHQTIKPPNVVKNSRASRMLALLPELQEPTPGAESVSTEETITEKTATDDNVKRGISGYSVGIIHHLTPSRKGSTVGLESPKRSPLRLRRSIRFDDDRNETVTYLTDSPPCQTIKLGMRFRGTDK